MRPFLKAFLFCDGVQPDSAGTYTVRGVWQQLRAPQLPASHPVTVFVCWGNLERPRYQMRLRIATPGAPEPFDAFLPVETRGEGRLDWMGTAVFHLHFAEEGDVVFEVFLDDEPYGACRLPVALA